MSDKIKEKEQLGMPIGTAANRLRKMLMFSMAQKLGMDICYQCGKPIAVCDDLSIEHKRPWLDVNPTLFWDLDNIAFSHLRCNIAAKRVTDNMLGGLRKAADAKRIDNVDGKAWCSSCSSWLDTTKFTRRPDRHNGLMVECNTCRSKRRSPKKWANR